MFNLSFFRFCLTFDYQSAVIERSVMCDCYVRQKECSGKTRQLSENLFGINKHEPLIQTFSVWIEEEQRQSRQVSQVGAALRNILGVWGFYFTCLS